jgi:protein arginine kinase
MMFNPHLITDRVKSSYQNLWQSMHSYYDIIVFSYARIDRNLANFPFRECMCEKQRILLLETLRNLSLNTDTYVPPESFNRNVLLLLEERKILRDNEIPDGFIITNDDVYIIINGFNHVSLFSNSGSSDFDILIDKLFSVENRIGDIVPFSFIKHYGYLSQNPQNCGYGFQLDTILHLPSLTMLKNISEIHNVCSKLNVNISPYIGNSEFSPFYLLTIKEPIYSNTLSSHKELYNAVEIIGALERDAREEYYLEFRHQIDDAIWRSFGMLSHARMLNYKETMDYLSNIRLGVILSIFKTIRISDINELIFSTKRNHILFNDPNAEVTQLSSELSRAQYIRNYFSNRS